MVISKYQSAGSLPQDWVQGTDEHLLEAPGCAVGMIREDQNMNPNSFSSTLTVGHP